MRDERDQARSQAQAQAALARQSRAGSHCCNNASNPIAGRPVTVAGGSGSVARVSPSQRSVDFPGLVALLPLAGFCPARLAPNLRCVCLRFSSELLRKCDGLGGIAVSRE